jgi:Putative transposase of IS4/5 family (DUF4096)
VGVTILIPYRLDSALGDGIMRKNLFWLSDEQWARIAPHLPTDVRGVEREDDRRVISGIVRVLKSGCRWQDCPPETVRIRRFTIGSRVGLSVGSGKTCSGNSPEAGGRQTRR